jgi:CRISPR-associated endoribonuclease Cas6
MLVSITVYLFPVEAATLPPTMGQYTHAAFLDVVRQMDEELGSQLHSNQSYKPFTVSPLQGRFDKQEKGKLRIRAGTECWLRFTILDDYLLSAVVKFFTEGKSSMLRLGDNVFQITKVITTGNGAAEDWSACTTFEELLDNASPFSKLSIRFYSPTAFRVSNGGASSAQNYVLPDPFYCFQSWLKKWNTFSGTHIDEKALLTFVRRHIQFSRYSIKTRIMNFGGYKQLGFVGDCEYRFADSTSSGRINELNEASKTFLRQAEALASFAFYSGTGYKTTMGMGQTRRQLPPNNKETSS